METQLRALLRAALPGVPVDWGWSAQAAVAPRVVLQIVSGVDDYTQGGPSGLAQTRVQMDVYGATFAAVLGSAALIDAALSGLRAGLILGAFKAGRRSLPPEMGAGETLARLSIDYMIHHITE
jgi:hypothetical protein